MKKAKREHGAPTPTPQGHALECPARGYPGQLELAQRWWHAVRRGTTLSHVELPGNPVRVLEGDITLIQCRVSLHARILDACF